MQMVDTTVPGIDRNLRKVSIPRDEHDREVCSLDHDVSKIP